MESFKFSFPILDIYDVGSADQLFIARIERREGWVWHFYGGCVLFGLMIVSLIGLLKRNIKTISSFSKKMIAFNAFMLTIMFATGIPLYIRAFIDIPMNIQDICRAIHLYTSYAYGVLIVGHIFMVVYRENKNKSSRISNMLKFNSFLVVALLVSLSNTSFAKEVEKIDHYEIGMAYYKGERGASVTVKTLPNCPYDFCKNAEIMKEKFGVDEIDDGTHTIEIKNPDLQKALFFLQKAVYEDKDERALGEALKLMLGEINYKDKRVDDYLLKNLEKTLGYENLDQYKTSLKKLLLSAAYFDDCYATFKLAEFYEKGYLQLFEVSTANAKKYYTQTTKVCKEGRFESIIAAQKI
jgi:uncharacterized membrane protein